MPAIERPANGAELQALLAEAAARREPIRLDGHGSKSAIGRAVRADRAVRLDRLSGVRLYEPDEMVLSAGAGTMLAEIEALLAGQGQRLAFAPPDWRRLLGSDAPGQSIGGIIAANLSGSVRLSAGAARDHFLGFSAVNGRGEMFKAGGRVVKNVTGYDLPKLLAGSFGTLAALTEVTLRVVPAPEQEITLALPGLDAAAATQVMARALAAPYDVAAAAWLPVEGAGLWGGSAAAAFLRLEGLTRSLDDRIAALLSLLRLDARRIEGAPGAALWRAIGDGEPLIGHAGAIWRVSLPPSAGAGLLATVPMPGSYLDWAGGLAWIAVPDRGDAGAQAIRGYVARHGGHATLLRACPETRAVVPPFEPRPAGLAALDARVREGFDPHGILNPGRMG